MTAVVIVFTFAGERFVGLVAEDIAKVVYSETAFSSARAWSFRHMHVAMTAGANTTSPTVHRNPAVGVQHDIQMRGNTQC